ncbi:MAG: leucine--tRNA ligase [Deltaproteobacteria bacterium GWB2_55_19]|nr:MAG: leucine--tRNA ligase [Deltaproteobacteria bacterium GWB2_55_19]HAO93999.1 leucine--tRNA ligase [Deltaproteobacteria bacterium]
MAERYEHRPIEERWQAEWEKDRAFSTSEDRSKGKFYVLEMFPYPSGKIHMGHVRNYSIGDVLARFLMMRGKNVLHPMGWDSFGLPAENAAIQHGTHPAKWTYSNIDNMRTQLKRMGFSYDWTREVATCTPEYYRWNQWIFLKLYEKGLAYKKRSTVNWCPGCATVLANEQVEDGLCWRCDSTVEMKDLEQWFLKITHYAEELLDFTYKLPGWPERVLVMQRNWIGKSVGAEVDFKIEGRDESIKIFTTRPDTLYGVTFMSIAAGHPMTERITTPEKKTEVDSFVKRFKAESKPRDMEEMKKEGVFTGAYCVNPLTGDRVPVYVANFVLMGYGTGAVMAVPAHDQRDFEFAKVYGLPINLVINPKDKTLDPATMAEAYVDDGVMVNSGPFDGAPNTGAMDGIIDLIEEKKAGRRSINYKLRDWGISRQRYWGCPIPVIYCAKCGTVPVPFDELPVILPEDVKLTGKGFSPLDVPSFTDVSCPKCNGAARRETDTMDTFVDSSWYFLRYISPEEKDLPFKKDEAGYWMPVDQYIGGIEHAVMHLLYARFFTKALRDLGLHKADEPFTNLLTQGMVCKEILKCPEHGYIYPEESKDGRCVHCGKGVEVGAVEKMSKSKKNVIDPDRIIERYGADTTRLFSLFAAPPEKDLDWSEDGVEGAYRFLGRVWRLVVENTEALVGVEPLKAGVEGPAKEVRSATHRTIERVTRDIEERFHFNTAISAVMELVNLLYQFRPSLDGKAKDSAEARSFKEAVESVVLLIAPFAPHISEELWSKLGYTTPVYKTPWPAVDESALVMAEVTVVIQINGKVRSKVNVPADSSEEFVRESVMNDEKAAGWIAGKEIKKFVYVPNKIVNIVVA